MRYLLLITFFLTSSDTYPQVIRFMAGIEKDLTAEMVGQIIGRELGWGADQIEASISDYLAKVKAQQVALEQTLSESA